MVDVSVIVPCGGGLDGVEDLVASLTRQQSRRQWEAVFVDNRLAEPARKKLGAVLHGLVWARVVSEPRLSGPSAARNAGVDAARGDVLVFVDADDVAAPEWLEGMVDAVRPGVVVAGRLDVQRLNPTWLASLRGGDPSALYWCEGVFPVAPAGNMAMLRADFDSMGGWDDTVTTLEDFDFCLRAWEAGLQIVQADDRGTIHYRLRTDPLVLYRQGRAYGIARARLYRRLRDHGYVSGPSLGGWRSWLLLLLWLPRAMSVRGRSAIAWIAGNRLGRVVGSARAGVLYI